jgi:hypothetical protein
MAELKMVEILQNMAELKKDGKAKDGRDIAKDGRAKERWQRENDSFFSVVSLL